MNFDHQARIYDDRMRLPAHIPLEISKSLGDYASISGETRVLEVGVGSGEISKAIVDLGCSYIGFDKSEAMIDIFLSKYNNRKPPDILQADGDEQWPVADGCIDVVFSSKALHLLNDSHVINEVNRIKGANGVLLVIGSIKKDPESVGTLMRKHLRKMLADQGFLNKGGEKERKRFFEKCVMKGARLIDPVEVVSWEISQSANDCINAWRGVEGLTGNEIDQKNKDNIIKKLELWATNAFESLDEKHRSFSKYFLSGVFFK